MKGVRAILSVHMFNCENDMHAAIQKILGKSHIFSPKHFSVTLALKPIMDRMKKCSKIEVHK